MIDLIQVVTYDGPKKDDIELEELALSDVVLTTFPVVQELERRGVYVVMCM